MDKFTVKVEMFVLNLFGTKIKAHKYIPKITNKKLPLL